MSTTRSQRVHVRDGATRTDDRFVSLTTHRLHATDVYVVGVLDGTGRLAEPTTLLATTDLQRARRHANTLFDRWGGEEVEPDHTAHLPRAVIRRKTGTKPPRPKPRVLRVFPPVYVGGRKGQWSVRWSAIYGLDGHEHTRGKRFKTKQEAQRFHDQLAEEAS